MDLESYVRERLRHKDIGLMGHIVLGYPSFEVNRELVLTMVDAGVDVLELQLPFSEPMADGPVIVEACHEALAVGCSVDQCFEFIAKLSGQIQVPVLIMSYFNLMFARGIERFAADMAATGASGAIVPDLPLEEAGEYLDAFRRRELSPVMLVAPNTTEARMREVSAASCGMLYCVARKGITGAKTNFSLGLDEYLRRVRRTTSLPLGVGFGVREPGDVDFLRGKAELAIVGSETLRVLNRDGAKAVGPFLRRLMGRA